uniref:Secreted protein n=1 Tax=Setaria italica TaxID=4555 RepID=K3YNB9_SETIT
MSHDWALTASVSRATVLVLLGLPLNAGFLTGAGDAACPLCMHWGTCPFHKASICMCFFYRVSGT